MKRLLLPLITLMLALPMFAAKNQQPGECFKVTQLNPVADGAYEIRAQNNCDQDFPLIYLSLVFTNKDGDKIGQCSYALQNVNAKEKFHDIQPSPVARAAHISVRKITDKPADLLR
jgi:hypothetical protein